MRSFLKTPSEVILVAVLALVAGSAVMAPGQSVQAQRTGVVGPMALASEGRGLTSLGGGGVPEAALPSATMVISRRASPYERRPKATGGPGVTVKGPAAGTVKQTKAPSTNSVSPADSKAANALAASPSVKPFLIYYGGFPSGATVQTVQAAFSGYPVVIFGTSWETPNLASAIVPAMPNTLFYGYADTGTAATWASVTSTLAQLESYGFQGVLLDDVGSGLSSNPANLQTIVDDAHADHLRVMLNAWDPSDVLALHLIPGYDSELCENWVYSDGNSHTPRRTDVYGQLAQIRQEGLPVFMIVTMGNANFTASDILQPVAKTMAMEGGQYISVSGQYYSAQTDAIFPATSLESVIGSAVPPQLASSN